MCPGDQQRSYEASLRELARDYELRAARAREFVPDHCEIPAELSFALDAAVNSGVAIGLTIALRTARGELAPDAWRTHHQEVRAPRWGALEDLVHPLIRSMTGR